MHGEGGEEGVEELLHILLLVWEEAGGRGGGCSDLQTGEVQAAAACNPACPRYSIGLHDQ